MRDKILIFGGTTEGRVLADLLRESGIKHEVSVATEYGKQIELDSGEDSVLSGRLSCEKIKELIADGYLAVVDATHPFAVKASKDIESACKEAGVEYIRLSRGAGKGPDSGDCGDISDATFVSDVAEAGKALEAMDGNILLLTGSKNLKEIMEEISDSNRVFVRVLPSTESIRLCEEAGVRGRQIIAMQGPFSAAMNEATYKEIGASVILTKESGETGGYYEKLEAARSCGIKAVVIRNPESQDGKTHMGMEEVIGRLEEICGKRIKRDGQATGTCDKKAAIAVGDAYEKKLVLAGIGPGKADFWTSEFREALSDADVIFGAESVVRRFGSGSSEDCGGTGDVTKDGTVIVPTYAANEILEYLKEHSEFKSPLVVYSGDISLASGAKKAAVSFSEAGYRVIKISGMSSTVLFANRISVSLEETRIISAHGKKCNVSGYARQNENLIVLPSDTAAAADIAEKLLGLGGAKDSDAGRGSIFRIIAGFELGTDDERIMEITVAKDISGLRSMKGKVLLYIGNPDARKAAIIPALADSDIIRGDVPMTKEEIRALSIRKLMLSGDSVLYDIGAGTGSISLEAALLHPDIEVYAFEKKAEAVDLIHKNCEKFGLENLHILEGEAPEILAGNPRPSHVFLGGSGQKLPDILKAVKEDNSGVRIVMNCVTLETLSEITRISEELSFDMDIIQVAVTRYNKRGAYHLADALNPVYIVTLQGQE